MMTLATRVKTRRRVLRMTQAQLAARTGMSQQAIQRIESGQIVRPRFLLEIAAALQCCPEWLVNGDTQKDEA